MTSATAKLLCVCLLGVVTSSASLRGGPHSASAVVITTAANTTAGCPLPTWHADGTWSCPDQSLTLEQRRNLLRDQMPFDEINGEKLDSWPATAGTNAPISVNSAYDYEGISYRGFKLARPSGERAPIHYHEIEQMLCLDAGKILVKTEGKADATYSAPDCYMMPAYTKVTAIILEAKVESCLFRVPHGGLDWVVIEPQYYNLQGQWNGTFTN